MNTNNNLRRLSNSFRFVTIIAMLLMNVGGVFPVRDVHAQTATISIRDDASGGNCVTVGIWDAVTKTCTLTTDVNGKLQIDSNNVTIDGAGHTIIGPNVPEPYFSGYGVYAYQKSNVGVRNLIVRGFDTAVYFAFVTNSFIEANTLYPTLKGSSMSMTVTQSSSIRMESNTIHDRGAQFYNSQSNIVRNNTLDGAGIGFNAYASYNQVEGNTVTNAAGAGLAVGASSSYNLFRNNTLINNQYGMVVDTYCTENEITNNLIQGSQIFGLFLSGAQSTLVYNNDMIDNTAQVYDQGTDSIFSQAAPIGGNYWSNYDSDAEGCFDSNEDGYCDAPLRVSAYSQKLDQLPLTQSGAWPNRFPVAEAGGPYTAIVNQPVMLDASASSDPDGDTLSYWWDLDNDGEYDDLGGPTPFTTFSQTGVFTIALQVSDVFGITSTDVTTVTVNPPAAFKLNIRAYIDGYSQLIISDSNAYWHHVWADAPGRTGGHDDPTYINGISWYPAWADVPDERNRDCNCDSSTYTGLNPALPQNETFLLNVIQARHAVSLIQQPTAGNDYTLIVEFDDGPPAGAEWYEVELVVDTSVHTPTFAAFYEEDYIEGGDWPEGAAVTLTVDDPATQLSPDHAATQIVSRKGDPGGTIWVQFWTGGVIDIQPGFVVTLSDGTYTKSTTVTNLKITHLDLALDRIEGTGDAGRVVNSWVCNQDDCEDATGRSVTPDASGYWLADYLQTNDPGEEVHDIKPGDRFEIVQIDDDGDLTEIRPRVPTAHFSVLFPRNAVHGYGWPMGANITLTIDDPSNGTGVDYSRTKTVGTENFRPPFDTWIGFELVDFTVKSGDIVTMTDGTTTKTHVTQELTVTNVDPAADTVAGTAAPGIDVGVMGGCDNNGCVYRNVPVDASGHWLADFSVPGDDDNEQAIFDIRLGASGHAEKIDDDGDGTVYDWKLGDPRIFALLGEQRVHAWGWMAGMLLTLTIDNPATPQSPDYTGTQVATDVEDWDHGAEWGITYEIQPGYLITVSGGGITKELTVAHLSVTNVDIEADTVSGTGDPGYEIHVGRLCDDTGCTRRNIYVDADGNWFADFSVPGYDEDETVFDIRLGSGTGVYQIDEDADATNIGWDVPNHTFSVRANDDSIEGFDWILGSTVTIEIDDPATPTYPDYTDTATVGVANWDPSQTYFGINTDGYDLKLGDIVTVSDGDITKQLLVTDFKITDVDLDNDIVHGEAGPNQSVDVWTCWQDDPCVNRSVRADQNGNWSENFGIAGDEDWEQETADLRPGSWIDSSARDDDSDTVMFGWYIPLNQPPDANAGPNQTVYASDPVMLDASASSDPDGDPLFYEWDLNYDGQYHDASGVTTATTFTQPGIYIVGLRVTDGGGLSSTDIVTITVLPWELRGFYQPVDMNGVYNIVKGGSTVPLKFEIFAGSELTDTTAVESLTYAQTSCDANAITDDVELVATGSTVLRYDAIAGQFIYNWKTPRMPGACFRITVTTIDDSALVAYFKLK